MKLTAANNHRIDTAGALALCISSTFLSGETLKTQQIVYFTDSYQTGYSYLSKLVLLWA